MPSFVFYSKRIVQWQGAPAIYATCMTPSDLLQWASVPRKSPRGMDGYQRPLADRYEKIARFIEAHGQNIIPGSIIVASDRGAKNFTISPVVVKGVKSEVHGLCKITLTYAPPASHKLMLDDIISQFKTRVPATELSAGKSRMAAFVHMLEHLQTNWTSEIDAKPPGDQARKEWLQWIEDRHKIGFIMDGQHRVFGAAAVNPASTNFLGPQDEPMLPVSIIPDISVAEQVFHFAMMNITPEKVKKAQANTNAAYSLSAEEFGIYEPRLQRFIDTTDAIWLDRMDSDSDSPFKGIIYHPWLPNVVQKQLKDALAESLQSAWRNANSADRDIGTLFRDAVPWEKDENEFRLKAFFTFWTSIKNSFPTEWATVGSPLWFKVSLLTLQDFIRKKMNEQVTLWTDSKKHPFEDLVSLGQFADRILRSFPADFFREWAYTPDDTDQGRTELMAYMTSQYQRSKVDRRAGLWKGA
jgi:hypothetical protein